MAKLSNKPNTFLERLGVDFSFLSKHPNSEELTARLKEVVQGLENANVSISGIKELSEKLADFYISVGRYILIPTPALLEHSERHFNAHKEQLNAVLTAKVSGETAQAMIQDYGKALSGDFEFTANPLQMVEALKHVKPTDAYLIDKYGFFWGVMKLYERCVGFYYKFTQAFTGETSTPETKLSFMHGDGNRTPIDALVIDWLLTQQYITLKDFKDIDRADVFGFIDGTESWADVGQYVYYYTIAKLCFGASDEELNAITPPPRRIKDGENIAVTYAKKYCDLIANRIQGFGNELVEAVRAETPQEKEQAKQEVEDWKSKTNEDIIRIPQNFALIQSRDLYGATDGEKAKDILPISAFIEHYLKGKDITLSPYIAERAIQGVNLLQRFHNVKPENGRYTFHTNLSEFANACGYSDANDTLKKQLLAALLVLNDMYVVVWKPKGRAAIKVITVTEIGLSGDIRGELKIEVTAEAMKGRPTLIGYGDIKKLQQAGKGAAQHHFNGQLLSKGHKAEDALLDEIFGYTSRIDEAKANNATDDDIKEIRTYIRKKKPTHKKTLLRMFEKAQADGVITYEKYTNKKGETVYKWERLRVPEPTGDEVQEPEEQ